MIPEQPLFWHQGLFLQPQHFQHLDRYSQSLVYPVQSSLQPYFWGVHHVELNEAALLNRVVEVTRLEAIFQDGTWVVLGKNGVLSSRSFADREDAFTEDESFPLYLGLKQWDRFGTNVTTGSTKEGKTRYVSDPDPREVEDLYHDGPTAQFYLMDHQMELFWGDEIEEAQGYSILPIGKLLMRGEEILTRSGFIPPAFMVQGAPPLLQILKQIREHIQSRCRVLETYKPAHNQSVKDLEPVSLHYLSALKTLNKYLALLHHLIETPRIHPWDLFGILRQLIGELSTFGDRMNALGQLRDGAELLPAYNHLDLETCFGEATRIIGELLDSIVIGSENIITLIRNQDMFSCEIPLEMLRQRGLYCLMVRSGDMSEQKVEQVIRHLKVGHCDVMGTLIDRALGGVPLEYRSVPPLGMARRTDSWCLELDTSHPRWHELSRDGRLCLHWDEAAADTAIEMVITRI